MKAEIKDNKLIITLDLQTPTPSSSGKMMIVASTNGFRSTDAKVSGKELSISVNAGFKP